MKTWKSLRCLVVNNDQNVFKKNAAYLLLYWSGTHNKSMCIVGWKYNWALWVPYKFIKIWIWLNYISAKYDFFVSNENPMLESIWIILLWFYRLKTWFLLIYDFNYICKDIFYFHFHFIVEIGFKCSTHCVYIIQELTLGISKCSCCDILTNVKGNLLLFICTSEKIESLKVPNIVVHNASKNV